MADRTASQVSALWWMRRALLALLGCAALLVAAVSIWVALDDRVSFHPFAPDAGDLMDEVIAKSGLSTSDSDPVVRTEEDGTTPDMADRTLRLHQLPAAITRSIQRACEALKLRPAGADWKRVEPDIVCEGSWKDRSVDVHLNLKCTKRCSAFLQTRVMTHS